MLLKTNGILMYQTNRLSKKNLRKTIKNASIKKIFRYEMFVYCLFVYFQAVCISLQKAMTFYYRRIMSIKTSKSLITRNRSIFVFRLTRTSILQIYAIEYYCILYTCKCNTFVYTVQFSKTRRTHRHVLNTLLYPILRK